VEAFPQSANAYDSLAEGYMDDGNNAEAIADYQKSLQLNPKNRNAALMLKKLNTP
jgi:cytochrome c-type biogenesis protein CcmH/NrfG